MTYFGEFALIVAAILSIYVCVSLFSWLSDSRRNHPYGKVYAVSVAVFGAVVVATLTLLVALIRQDYSFSYVAEYSSADMPLYLKMAALWAGQSGSMLFWMFLLSGFTAHIAYRNRKNPDTLTSYALLVLTAVELFFLAVLILVKTSNPFVAGTAGANGMGMNPLLQHWAMVFHPPTLFMGYAGFTIPFAYAIAALLSKDSSSEWAERSHKWTLFSWLFLSAGIILGALWAYVVLGWGGYWGWDPVENASLVPWLVGVAFLHSLTAYRRRGNLKMWTLALAAISFILCIVATFVTRSGLITSVHAYEKDLMLTTLFGTFMAGTVGLSAYLMIANRKRYSQDDSFQSLASKQFTYYLNNIMMLAFAGIILFASTILPFFGQTWSVDNYNSVARPLTILYMLLLIACPYMGWVKTEADKLVKRLAIPTAVTALSAVPIWLAWGPSTETANIMDSKPVGFIAMLLAVFLAVSVIELFVVGAQVKAKNKQIGFFSSLFSIFKYNRSTSGGYMTHLGIAITIFGIVGSMMYTTQMSATFNMNKPGFTIQVGKYELRYKKPTQVDEGSVISTRAYFDVYRNGRRIGEIAPKMAYFKLQGQMTRQVAVAGGTAIFNPSDLKLSAGSFWNRYNPLEDLFVSLNADENSQDNLSVEAKINPLVSFVWLGSLLVILGTTLAYWPKRAAVTETVAERKKPHGGRVPVEA